MSIDYTVLNVEILTDPLGCGYAGYLSITANGGDLGIVNLLNSQSGVGSQQVPINTMEKGQFLLSVAPWLLSISDRPANIQAKWDRILLVLSGAPNTINVSSDTVKLLFNAAIADQIATKSQVDSISSRNGSRAEVLFGVDTVVTSYDVAHAMGRI